MCGYTVKAEHNIKFNYFKNYHIRESFSFILTPVVLLTHNACILYK